MRFGIVSASLDVTSKSRILAELAGDLCIRDGHDIDFIDLRDVALPRFDNGRAFHHPSYQRLHRIIAASDGVFLASPVYNWGLSAAAKNLIELTGSTGESDRRGAWFDKIVTFLCAGGLPHSYMAAASLATSLMLDFKCVINPYQVYATERDWAADGAPSPSLRARLEKTVAVKLELAAALRHRTYRSEWEI